MNIAFEWAHTHSTSTAPVGDGLTLELWADRSEGMVWWMAMLTGRSGECLEPIAMDYRRKSDAREHVEAWWTGRRDALLAEHAPIALPAQTPPGASA